MIKLRLNHEIYSDKFVNMAIAAYKELAKITIIHGKRNSEIIFTHCKYGEEQTAKEFENYLICLENS